MFKQICLAAYQLKFSAHIMNDINCHRWIKVGPWTVTGKLCFLIMWLRCFNDISWRKNIEDCQHDHEMIIFWKERETCYKGFGQNGGSQKRSCLGKRCLSSNKSYAWVDAACKYYLCENGGRQFLYQEKWNKSLQFVENYFVNDAYIFVFCERSVTSLRTFSTYYVTSLILI